MKLTTRLLSVLIAGIALLSAGSALADDSKIAVLYFDNNTGDAGFDPLKKGMADMMVTDLSGVVGLQVVERSRLQEVLDELKLQKSSHFDPKTARKLGKLVGAEYAVTGAIASIDPALRLDVRLIEVETGRVVVADKIVGDKGKFFKLQGELVVLFVKGLNKKVTAKSQTKVEDVSTIVQYGQGLDLADKGDVKGASKKIQGVMTKAPGFKLAQKRYSEMMKRLYAAKDKRETSLSSAEDLMHKKIDEVLSAGMEGLSKREIRRYLSYRILRGNTYLGKLNKMLDNKGSWHSSKALPTDKIDEAKKLMIAYVDNGQKLIEELKGVPPRQRDDVDRLDDEDAKAAEQAGLGDAGSWSFLSLQVAARDAAQFALLGRPDFFNDISIRVSPTLASLEPKYAEVAFGLLELAIDDIKKNTMESQQAREIIRTKDLWAEALYALKRPAEAIGKWQEILDAYPTNEEFDNIEKKVRFALSKLQ
ncbi:MAG: TolB-like protein [Myxococcota bacterium]|jgi:TolB-like protein